MTEQDPSRRQLLERAAAALAAGLGAAAASPLVAALIDPIAGGVVRLEGREIDAGPAAGFGPSPRRVALACSRLDAWTRTESEVIGAVYVIRDGDRVRAFSAVCPHASCSVSYEEARGRFGCPCHQSYFQPTGAIISGPGPRGLDELPVTLRGGRVIVTYKRFRPGIREQQEV